MRAFLCHEYGEAKDMKVEEVPAPKMTAGNVRIAIKQLVSILPTP